MTFELNKRLVIINGENSSGSAILINNQGLVISCYHNFYDKKNEQNIIKTLSIKTEGFWVKIPYSNNVDFCFEETKYDDLESDDIFLFRLKIDKNSNGIKDLPKLSISRNVKQGDEVTVIAWDNIYDKNLVEHQGKVISVEPKTKGHPNRFHIKLDGYPGYSGGGVFKNGELVGIINYIQTQRLNNIIASFIPNYIVAYSEEEIQQISSTTTATISYLNPSSSSSPSSPLSIWLEKKQFLETELAKTFDANQKFALRKQIQECEQEITRLASQNNELIEVNQNSASNKITPSSTNVIENNSTNTKDSPISNQKTTHIFRQGTISTSTVAFLVIDGLKQVGGIESVELLSKLHFIIKLSINSQKYKGVQVLSSLSGAIIIFPDALQQEPLRLITTINTETVSLGIAIKVGMSRGEIQELADIDRKSNFIGVCINQAARLATAKLDNHPGLLVHESLANHLQATLRASNWLSNRNPNRLSVEILGKRDEKFLCYYPPVDIWPKLSSVSYKYDENSHFESKNAALVAYDLPNFSDGDLNQLSQRFRAISDVFLALVAETNLPLKYFYFSPGGDGGVMVFTDLEKKPVFDLAKNFAEKLLIESQNKGTLISSECRIGLHYGTVLLYENAQGSIRPVSEDIFIADELLADKEIRNLGSFVFTEEFKTAVSGGDDKFFFQVFQSAPALKLLFRNISRYVYKLVKPNLSCSEYLASLSKTDLYRWIKLNLSTREIEQVWFALFDTPIEKESKTNSGRCIVELYKKAQDSYSLPNLYKELAKQSVEPYEILPFDNNQVLELIEQAAKEKSISLDLSCQSLKDLPKELLLLTELETLSLVGNELTSLPKEINSLNQLVYLDLYDNQLASLPSAFGSLNLLENLDLSYNRLQILPSAFGDLVNLSYLNISNNKLTSLPNEIGELKKLKFLSVQYNELNLLPSEFGNLTAIEELDLSYNKLTLLPNEFGKLVNLQLLYLSHNQLAELPNEFGDLTSLKSLYLSANKLSRLPEEFGNLTDLEFLYLSHNQLSQLPIEMANLTKLKKLYLQENKPELERTIPPEILKFEDTPQKILNYLSETVKTSLDEVKMLVVGEGKVGKTSLVKRLINNDFNPLEPMTKGIAIKKQWPLRLTEERELKVNIWDFGGQEIMHATHQFFLTKRSLYLLVLDARHDEQQNRLNYWLKTIDNFAGDSPIIVVVNQIDSGSLELERKKLKQAFPNIKAFIETSCKEPRGIDLLTQQILTELSQSSIADTLVPYNWIVVKNQLESLQKYHKDHLEYSDYHQICEQSELDKQHEETLIDFLHDLGVVLCFRQDLRIKNDQILNPGWITKGVYKILTHNGSAINKGILTTANLATILNIEEYSWNDWNFIIEMMLKFELCFDLEDSNRNKLLIPDLLEKDSPQLGDWQDSLRFQYDYDDFLPSSVISRFIVKVHNFIYKDLYWRYGVVIESLDKHNRALIKVDLDKNKAFIYVNGRSDTRKILLFLIREKFISINKTIPKIKVKEQIPLPENDSVVFDYEYLLQLIELGEEFIIPPGIMRKIPIRPLLEGIETKSPLLTLTNVQDNISNIISNVRENVSTQINNAYNPSITYKNVFDSNLVSVNDVFNLESAKPTYKTESLQHSRKAAKPIHILHLSDIHLGTISQSSIYYSQLQLDLIQNLKLETLNYLLISGDIANKSTKEEYDAAFNLIKQIKEKFNLGNDQVVLVPGNHDLNWNLSAAAYQYIPKFELPNKLTDDYIEIPNGALLRDEKRYRKRFDNFCDFYLQVTGKNYPTDYEEQAVLHIFREHKILVLGLNSAWQIDHNYTNRAAIHQVALGKTLNNINSNDYQDWLKIAIWHHPITGQQMMNADFLEQLAVAGFEVCLHGHIHEAISSFYNYDSKRGLHIIGGGTFGAPTNEQVTGIPLQYNLLVLQPGTTNLTVKTRKKEKVDGAWSADARWGDKESPKADYTIHVKNLIPYPSPSSDSVNKTILFRYETVKVDNKGNIIERHKKEGKQYIEDLGNRVVLEMVEIPSGEFMMGSLDGEGDEYEKPQHKVTVPAFYMGKYQVTQEQWEAVMGNNPSYFKGNGKLPVEQVSWNDAIEFCKRLSEKTNKIYRLPSEAEWEYACRAGTETAFAFGETINTNIVNYNGNHPYGEEAKGEYRDKTTVVGSLGVANEFGLYDMHGNVWEWCKDEWHSNYEGAPIDGSIWENQDTNNTFRIVRGGSFSSVALVCRSAARLTNTPNSRNNSLGFRLVMIT